MRLAGDAAEFLVDEQRRNLLSGNRGWWLGEDADHAANERLLRELADARPDDGVLSEEEHDDLTRLDRTRTWIIDPLDGSGGFAHGGGDWAVHVALTVDGVATAGAVAVPAMGEVFSTLDVGSRESRADSDRLNVVVGRSRVRTDGQRVAAALDADLQTCGSAGVKAMLVVAGEADVYVHGAPLYEWDACAPAAVATAAGLSVTDAGGEPLVFNGELPIVPGFVVCRPELLEAVIGALR